MKIFSKNEKQKKIGPHPSEFKTWVSFDPQFIPLSLWLPITTVVKLNHNVAFWDKSQSTTKNLPLKETLMTAAISRFVKSSFKSFRSPMSFYFKLIRIDFECVRMSVAIELLPFLISNQFCEYRASFTLGSTARSFCNLSQLCPS